MGVCWAGLGVWRDLGVQGGPLGRWPGLGVVWGPRGRFPSLGGSGVLGSSSVIPLPLCVPWDAPPPSTPHDRHGTPVLHLCSCRRGCGRSWRGHRDPLGRGTWGACPFFRPLSARPCGCGPLHPWRCPTVPCAIPGTRTDQFRPVWGRDAGRIRYEPVWIREN